MTFAGKVCLLRGETKDPVKSLMLHYKLVPIIIIITVITIIIVIGHQQWWWFWWRDLGEIWDLGELLLCQQSPTTSLFKHNHHLAHHRHYNYFYSELIMIFIIIIVIRAYSSSYTSCSLYYLLFKHDHHLTHHLHHNCHPYYWNHYNPNNQYPFFILKI